MRFFDLSFQIFLMFIRSLLILTLIILSVPRAGVFAQSPELQSAKKDVVESIQKLAEDQDSPESRKATLIDVVEFSIIETNDLIKKLSALKIPDGNYGDLRSVLISDLKDLLDELDFFLEEALEVELDLDKIKEVAEGFKEWREVYSVEARKTLEFLLVFQMGNILKIVDSRYSNIADDLHRFRNSTVINVALLQPIFDSAEIDLKQAKQLYQEGLTQLFQYLPDDENFADGVEQPIQIKKDIPTLMSGVLLKIKSAYQKFINMSRMVDKMVEKK